MRIRTALYLALALAVPSLPAAWVVSWGASPSPQLPVDQMRAAKLVFANQTVRQIVHTSIGGDTVRVRLSNAFGKDTVSIGAAHIAVRSNGPEIIAGSGRALTFGGRPVVSIPPDAVVLSDPVKLQVPAAGDLAISLFLPQAANGAGLHYASEQTSYVVPGDQTGAATFREPATFTSWVFLAGVDVLAPDSAAAVVAFGDSITDGARSTLDANRRWPNILAGRLLARPSGYQVAVLDAGIGGNRVLHDGVGNVRFGVNALARFDRDVLVQPGVKYVILLEGINDLGHAGSSAPAAETVSAEDLIAGLKQMIERAHEKGMKVFGGTLVPFEGTVFPGYFSREKEVKRKAINDWVRAGGAFDAVIDFDQALRDPERPDRLLPAYDSGDHLHPSDAGYKAMGEAIDLSIFR